MPSLYIVATPIGNLEDVTHRAIRVLKEVDLIAAEDTRRTRRLLARYDIHTRMTPYHDHNRRRKLPHLMKHLEEHDLALVSEAGMPGISDPGFVLITAAAEAGIDVVPIPGPSAVVTAMAVSGLPSHRFLYLGFLPRKKGERRRLFEGLAEFPYTLVAFESPHRLRASLVDIQETLGDRHLAVCREMTKLHEEIFRGSVSDAQKRFSKPRGEFTLVIAAAEVVRNE